MQDITIYLNKRSKTLSCLTREGIDKLTQLRPFEQEKFLSFMKGKMDWDMLELRMNNIASELQENPIKLQRNQNLLSLIKKYHALDSYYNRTDNTADNFKLLRHNKSLWKLR